MKLDVATFQQVLMHLPTTVCERHFGDEGLVALRRLHERLPSLMRHLPPSFIRVPLVVASMLCEGDTPFVPLATVPAQRLDMLPDLQSQYGPLAIVMDQDAECISVGLAAEASPIDWSSNAIVFVHEDRVEHFCIGGERVPVLNPLKGMGSAFAVPSFDTLEDALERYAVDMVSTGRCQRFQQAWREVKRLVFCHRPEHHMRDSLEHFLAATLEGHDGVRPEQNVDDSHPVDLRVTWGQSRHVALIEIKWMGRSVSKDGSHVTCDYGAARANEGARQLADYLDRNFERASRDITKGYLVVIDGRRRGVDVRSLGVSAEDGLHYQAAEVTYDPPWHLSRDDFHEPYRFFCKPIDDGRSAVT